MRAFQILAVVAALAAPATAVGQPIESQIEDAIASAPTIECNEKTTTNLNGQNWCFVKFRFKDGPEIAISVAFSKSKTDPAIGWRVLSRPKLGLSK